MVDSQSALRLLWLEENGHGCFMPRKLRKYWNFWVDLRIPIANNHKRLVSLFMYPATWLWECYLMISTSYSEIFFVIDTESFETMLLTKNAWTKNNSRMHILPWEKN